MPLDNLPEVAQRMETPDYAEPGLWLEQVGSHFVAARSPGRLIQAADTAEEAFFAARQAFGRFFETGIVQGLIRHVLRLQLRRTLGAELV